MKKVLTSIVVIFLCITSLRAVSWVDNPDECEETLIKLLELLTNHLCKGEKECAQAICKSLLRKNESLDEVAYEAISKMMFIVFVYEEKHTSKKEQSNAALFFLNEIFEETIFHQWEIAKVENLSYQCAKELLSIISEQPISYLKPFIPFFSYFVENIKSSKLLEQLLQDINESKIVGTNILQLQDMIAQKGISPLLPEENLLTYLFKIFIENSPDMGQKLDEDSELDESLTGCNIDDIESIVSCLKNLIANSYKEKENGNYSSEFHEKIAENAKKYIFLLQEACEEIEADTYPYLRCSYKQDEYYTIKGENPLTSCFSGTTIVGKDAFTFKKKEDQIIVYKSLRQHFIRQRNFDIPYEQQEELWKSENHRVKLQLNALAKLLKSPYNPLANNAHEDLKETFYVEPIRSLKRKHNQEDSSTIPSQKLSLFHSIMMRERLGRR